VTAESNQLAAPLVGGWVRSGFKTGFNALQDFKMEVIAGFRLGVTPDYLKISSH
jgi:hypothetical protein